MREKGREEVVEGEGERWGYHALRHRCVWAAVGTKQHDKRKGKGCTYRRLSSKQV